MMHDAAIMTSSKTEDGTSVANDSVRTMIVPKKQ
jgi:hypothetical protein